MRVGKSRVARDVAWTALACACVFVCVPGIFDGLFETRMAMAQTQTKNIRSRNDVRPFAVWLHKYDWEAGVSSVRQHADSIAEVGPAWYQITADASIQQIDGVPVDSPELFVITQRNHITLRPLLMNVLSDGTHPEFVRALFSDTALRQVHVAGIQTLVQSHGYDGIDLDYEGFNISELPALAELVEEVAKALHAIGKTLAVDIEVQSNDDCLPSWQRIGVVADKVRIMTYGQTKLTPGPLADLSWIQSNITRALKVIPVHKLVQGIAVYGLSWSGQGNAVRGSGTWATYTNQAEQKHAVLDRDEETKTAWYTFQDTTVWFEDHESVAMKIALGRSLGLQHIALWRLGGEDPEIFSEYIGLPRAPVGRK